MTRWLPTAEEEQRAWQALADRTRREICELLLRGEARGGDIAQAFDMGWPAVSRHLSMLRDAGLVDADKRGRNVFFSLRREAFAHYAEQLSRFAQGRPSGGARFTDQLQALLASAHAAARDAGSAFVGAEHILAAADVAGHQLPTIDAQAESEFRWMYGDILRGALDEIRRKAVLHSGRATVPDLLRALLADERVERALTDAGVDLSALRAQLDEPDEPTDGVGDELATIRDALDALEARLTRQETR